MLPDNIGIIGLGSFGRFWGEKLADNCVHPFTVYGYDRFSAATSEKITFVSLDQVCRCPVVFLCVPMRSLPGVLREIAPLLPPDTLVADTCSVKVMPSQWMQAYLPPEQPLLAVHPMFGAESGKASLLGLSLMLFPVRNSTVACSDWMALFTSLGLIVTEMSPDEHDRQAAYSQALTHLVGRTLNMLGVEETVIATRWYRDLLAICRQVEKDSIELFEDMQNLNPYAPAMRHSFEEAYKKVLDDLDRTKIDLC